MACGIYCRDGYLVTPQFLQASILWSARMEIELQAFIEAIRFGREDLRLACC